MPQGQVTVMKPHSIHTPAEVHATVMGAIDWLEANPDKHIRRDFAATDEGYTTTPGDPKATCFCVLGRIAHDIGLECTDLTTMHLYLNRAGIAATRLMTINDTGIIVDQKGNNYLRIAADSAYEQFKKREGLFEWLRAGKDKLK